MSCKNSKVHLSKTKSVQIPVTDSIIANSEIENFIKPYRNQIKKDLDSVLTYSANTYSKTNGSLNTAIGNYMADAVYTEVNPIFKKRTGFNIDMVLLNYGGIRAPLPKGRISTRHAYQIMPFENSVVVIALKGTQIDSLVNYLIKAKKAHPIAKLQLTLNKDFELVTATIKNQAIEDNKTYYVATSDYLYNGGDKMTFFKTNESLYTLDYKLRNILIDSFKKTDTIAPIIDNRFTQIK